MATAENKKESRFRLRHLPSLIKETAINWTKDDPWRLSAVVAYYALLSLPGLLVIIFSILNFFWKSEIVEGEIYGQIETALGASSADTVEAIFKRASETETTWLSVIIISLWVTYSCLILFFGAEFTWVYTKRYGYKMTPKSQAMFVD